MTEEFKKAETGKVVKFEEKGDSIEGVYIGWKESSMYEKSYGVEIETEDEGLKVVFVSSIVTDLIATNQIQKGMTIKIVYEGKVQTQDGKREYKDYSVYFKPKK